jgi:predicted transcriptional regulator of viral defense system
VLTTEELAKLLHRSRTEAARLAFDLRKRGLLSQVRRGVYASVPLEVDPAAFQPDPFLVARTAVGEAYVFSHQSALALHGAEQTVRKTVDLSAPAARARTRRIGGLVIRFHAAPPEGWREGVTTVRHGGVALRVTTPERTLVDLAGLPNSHQDYEEDLLAFRALLPFVDAKRLLREVHHAPRPSTRARVGHLLEVSGVDGPRFSSVVRALSSSAKEASPGYFATRPGVASNRFDSRFQLVYPGRG